VRMTDPVLYSSYIRSAKKLEQADCGVCYFWHTREAWHIKVPAK
jgi:hypothetical protein